MKRTIIAMAAAIMMSSAAMAQNRDSVKLKKFDKSEMIKKRTEAVAQRYGLDAEQSAKLLELNTQYADSLRPRMPQRFDRRNGNMVRRDGNGKQVKRDSTAKSPRNMPEGQREKMRGQRNDMRGTMNNYNAQLKTIMTEEQYQKYTEDLQKRMNNNGSRGSGKVKTTPTSNK